MNVIINMKKEAKVLSNILYIVTKIIKIASYVLIGIMAVFMVLTPILFKNITIDNNTQTITLGKEEVYYTISNNKLEIFSSEKDIFSTTLDQKSIIRVYNLLNKDIKFYMLVSEYIFIAGIVFMTLVIMVLKNTESVFKNIANDNTPFTNDNVLKIQEVAKYMIVGTLVMYVLTLFLQVILRIKLNVHIDLNIIIYVIALYLLSYIFEYGMQKEK